MNTFPGILTRLPFRIRWLPLAAGSLVLLAGVVESRAQPPGAPAARVVEGTVQQMTTAPRGEIDGAVLNDGTWLHWPPHLTDRFADVLREGDRVRAAGRTETGPAGDTHFEIQSVTNIRTSATAENPDSASGPPPRRRAPHGRGMRFAPPPPPPVDRRSAPAEGNDAAEVRGTVRRMTTAPR